MITRRLMSTTTTLASAALAMLLACPSIGTADELARPMNDDARAAWQADMGPVTKALWKLSRSDRQFAGVGLDASTGAAILYRKADDAPKSEVLSKLSGSDAVIAAGHNVEVRPAMLSAREAKRVMRAVLKARQRLKRKNIVITGVGTTIHGPVVISVKKLSPEALALADRFAFYGAGTVTVEEKPSATPLSRFDDTPAFTAGDRIFPVGVPAGSNGGGCSSGFGGLSTTNGKRYMLTAAHCVDPRDARLWADGGYNGVAGPEDTPIGKASVIDKGHDLAFVPASTRPYVWDGPLNGQFQKKVIDVDPPAVGAQVCTSGATSGARCYATVNGWGHIPLDNGTVATLWWADSNGTNGSRHILAPGDSGGPVFTPKPNNTVVAIGVISAGDFDEPGAPPNWTVPCTGVMSAMVPCSRRVYFSDIHTEAVENRNLDLTR